MDGNMMDGVQPDGVVASPASSGGAGPARPRQKQVPISRNAASGYERPERARTSHACEPCRDRKTKCDGERPSCRRCLHNGTQCHYGYGKGWKKRKTAEDLTVTSSKLARYEKLLNDIFPLVSPDVRSMIDDARGQDFSPNSSMDNTDLPNPAKYPFDLDRRTSPSMVNRLPPPPSVPMTQSAPAFITTPRTLPHPLPIDASQSPLPQNSNATRSSKSPSDDTGMSPAIRLPSITRHGYLVEDGSRPPVGSVSGTPLPDGHPPGGNTAESDQQILGSPARAPPG